MVNKRKVCKIKELNFLKVMNLRNITRTYILLWALYFFKISLSKVIDTQHCGDELKSLFLNIKMTAYSLNIMDNNSHFTLKVKL